MSLADSIAKLRESRAQKLAKAEVLGEMSDLTDEQSAKLDSLLEEIDTDAAELAKLEERQAKLDKIEGHRQDLDRVRPPRSAQDGEIEEPLPRTEGHRERWMDDPMKGYKSPREFFDVVAKTAGQRTELKGREAYLAADEKGIPLHMAAGSDEQSTFSDPYGGFLVPAGMSPDMLSIMPEADPMMGRTTMIPMGSPKVEIPARVDKNHSNSVTGGLRAYRRAEADQAASSRMQVEQIKLEANNLTGLAYVTDELMNDSPTSVAALLDIGFRDEFTSKLIEERLTGTGAGEYLGVNNSDALITAAKETGQAADTIIYDNIVNMRARVWRYTRAIWLYNHDALPQLMKLKDDDNKLIWQPSARDGEPDMLLGRPAFATEYTETVGDAGDLICVNWGEYLEGVYQPLETAESIHVRFVNHEKAFRFNVRNAGMPWWRSALTPKNSSTTLSPYVRLGARA